MSKHQKIVPGQKFGLLTTIERWSVPHNGKLIGEWKCKCECGKIHFAATSVLNKGDVKSCGCAKGSFVSAAQTTHKLTKTATYASWSAMRSRCNNPFAADYPRYGGKGIKICPEWESFEQFLTDMGERPNGKTLERLDNKLGYSKENCRWASRFEQAQNRSSSKLVCLNGEMITCAEASRRLFFDRGYVHNYASYHNVSLQEAVDCLVARENVRLGTR